jgi:hypothetical protein
LGAPFLKIVSSVIPFSNQYSTWSASVIPRSQIPGSGGLFESKLVRSYTWNLYLVTVLPGISCFVTKSFAGTCIFCQLPVNRKVLVSLSCLKDKNCPGNLSLAGHLAGIGPANLFWYRKRRSKENRFAGATTVSDSIGDSFQPRGLQREKQGQYPHQYHRQPLEEQEPYRQQQSLSPSISLSPPSIED